MDYQNENKAIACKIKNAFNCLFTIAAALQLYPSLKIEISKICLFTIWFFTFYFTPHFEGGHPKKLLHYSLLHS